jgi:hypothetical protein
VVRVGALLAHHSAPGALMAARRVSNRRAMEVPMSRLSIQSALITAVAIAGFAVGRWWPATPADERTYYVKAIENSLTECLENLKEKEAE